MGPRLLALAASLALPVVALAQGAYRISDAERLIAAIQDGGKVIYLLPIAGAEQAGTLGRALRALRVPLNDIVASPAGSPAATARLAFGESAARVSQDFDDRASALLRTPPPPGHNRVLVGDRGRLEAAAGRRFSVATLPEGAMAIFLPGDEAQLLGTVASERVIMGAEARGALGAR